MNTLEAIYGRRSVKHYDIDHRIPEDEERRLLEAATQAPSSFNIQHWRLVILRDKELRRQIRDEFAGGQPQITDASLLVLFTADVKAWRKEPERLWQNAPAEVRERMSRGMVRFHENRSEQFQRDEAQRSIGMAMQTLMLAAHDLGYESCPMIGFNAEGVAKLIRLPDDHVMGAMVAIGRGTADPPWERPQRLPVNEVSVENTF
jgi:nitroreductase